METPASPAAPAVAQTPAATGATFTSEPIKVAPEPVTAEVKTETPKEPEPLVTALAKASAGERAAKKSATDLQAKITELTAKLEKSDEGSAKAAKLEAELAELFDKPRLYLKRYKPKGEDGEAFKEILADFGADDPVTDPRVTELLAKDAARDAAEAKAKEDKEAADKVTADKEYEETNKRAIANIQSLIGEEGAKPGADGIERFAIVSMDEGAATRAREEVVKYLTEKKINATSDQARELILQALDQMETHAREGVKARAAKLNPPDRRSSEASFSEASQTQHLPATERSPVTTIANLRESPLPAPGKPVQAHGFTGGLR